MPALTKTQIHDAQDIVYRRVETPEWGGYVIAKGLNGLERQKVETVAAEQVGAIFRVDPSKLRVMAVLIGAVDDDHNPIFTEEDQAWLLTKSAAAMERVASAVLEISGLMPDSKDKAVANFTPTSNGALHSVLP
mgnify:CR=1 FL=1